MPQDDPTAVSPTFAFSLPTVTSSASHGPLAECASDSDKLAAIRSPPHDVVSDTPNSGSDEEEEESSPRVSLPNHDVDDNFSLKLSTEGSDTASTRLSVEPEAVPVMEEKHVSLEKPMVSETNEVLHELNSKVEEVTSSCATASIGAEQQKTPTSQVGPDLGLCIQEDVGSLRGQEQFSETVHSTEKEATVVDGNCGMEEKPVLPIISHGKGEGSEGKEMNRRTLSSRPTRKKTLETKASSPTRKYFTRKSVTSTSSIPSPVQPPPCPPASQPLCEEHPLPMLQPERKEDEIKKPPAALRLTDAGEAEQQTALLVPSTNSLTIITSTYSMSATFVPDTAPNNALLTTLSPSTLSISTPTVATPGTSTPRSQETKHIAKRGRGRPRKHTLVQREGPSKEKMDCAAVRDMDGKKQSSLAGNVKQHRQKRGGQTTGEDQELMGEDVCGKDTKKSKMSDPNDDKHTERRRSLRERVRVPPLLEQSGIFTQRRKPRKSSSSCALDMSPEAGPKSGKDVQPRKGSTSSSRTSIGQQVSPTSQPRTPRRNSSRSYAKSPRKKQASRRSDEGIPIHRNWLCALCNCGNSCNGLGYLYGPYRYQEMSEKNANKSSPEKGNLTCEYSSLRNWANLKDLGSTA